MSDPKQGKVEIDDLEIARETLLDLSSSEAGDARGGNLARSVGVCAGQNVPTGLQCPHVTDACGQMIDAEKLWDNQDNLP